jgi:xanthine dehydrogenase/oxidase
MDTESFLLKLSSSYGRVLHFFINNKETRVENVDPKVTLLDYLRENGYTGTKHGCGEGGCGACTVVIAEYDAKKEKIKYRTANSCLFLLCSAHLKQIITIEGIGDNNNPHPTQVSWNLLTFLSYN